MKFVYNDGGRELAGFKGKAGDCVARAIAIAAERPYAEVYETLAHGNENERITRGRNSGKRTARNGIHVRRRWFKNYMTGLGFKWFPTMGIGTGCKVHLHDGELPMGRLVVSVSNHYTAVIDGVIHDIYEPSRDGTRCVYGYYQKTQRALRYSQDGDFIGAVHELGERLTKTEGGK